MLSFPCCARRRGQPSAGWRVFGSRPTVRVRRYLITHRYRSINMSKLLSTLIAAIFAATTFTAVAQSQPIAPAQPATPAKGDATKATPATPAAASSKGDAPKADKAKKTKAKAKPKAK